MRTIVAIAFALSLAAMVTATNPWVTLLFAAGTAYDGYWLVRDSKAREQRRIRRALERDFGYEQVRMMMRRDAK